MVTRKPAALLDLRDALREPLEDAALVAERFERLGATGVADDERQRLERLDAGEPVTVSGAELSVALEDVGAPLAELRRVAVEADHWTVDERGRYEPAV